MHHTGCGMLTFTTPGLQTLIKEAEPDNGSVAEEVNKINFLEFPHLEESVKNDIRFLEEHPLVLKGTKITGWIYHIESGKVGRSISGSGHLYADWFFTGRSDCVNTRLLYIRTCHVTC